MHLLNDPWIKFILAYLAMQLMLVASGFIWLVLVQSVVLVFFVMTHLDNYLEKTNV